MITVSVPGKIHLMGEHAVVYGKPALLSAINRRMRVSIEKSKKMEIFTTESPTCVFYALEKVKEYLKLDLLSPMRISIDSDIPAGFHLGSSAATAVGVIAALIYFLKKTWNPTLINAIAYEVEKKQHGNPSGGDNTTVAFGGLVWFRKEMEFLKSMQQLDIVIPSAFNHFYLIDTGRPKETTGEMVAFVKTQKNLQAFLDANEIQTKNILVGIKEKNEGELLDAIQQGEKTLETIGVVSKKVIPIIRSIEKAGGAAKILGGGGRKEGIGYLLCYSHNPPKGSIPIVLGEEGVRLERKL